MPERSDTDIDRELEYLELQECPAEIESLVCPIREELEAELDPTYKATPRTGAKEDLPVDPEGFAESPGLPPRGELVIQPLPSVRVSGDRDFSSDEEHDRGSQAFHEDMPLKSYMQAVVERLSRLENRIEEQQGWMERNLVTGRSRMTRKVQDGGLDYNLLKEWSKQSMRMSKRSITHPSEAIPMMGQIQEETDGLRNTTASSSSFAGGQAAESQESNSTAQGPTEARANNSGQMPTRRSGKALQFKEDDNETINRYSSQSQETIRSRQKKELSQKRLRDRQQEREKGKENAAAKEVEPKTSDEKDKDKAQGRLKAGQASVRQPDKPKILSGNSSIMITDGGLQNGILYRIVAHSAFDYFFASMIMLNSLFIGVQTEYRARSSEQVRDHMFFEVAEQIFAYMFAIELLMRMGALKMAFFNPKTLTWNLFDILLVVMSVVEIVLNASTTKNADAADTSNAGKVIRMFRMARIVRIMRVLRFLAELRIMVTLIMNSARSLFWLMILLLGILYVFSIFFTQGVTDFLKSPDSDGLNVTDTLHNDYGSLLKSAYTLFASITGGVSWRDVLNPLTNTGAGFTALFICYVFFCIFSVLNIVTGVFVDGAIQRSSQERDLRLEKEKEQKKMYVSMLTDLLEEIDSEGTGVISREDLEEAFKSEQVRYYFSVLDIDVTDSNYLFDMLDLDRSGEVDMEEFVSGCLRLKGNAKSIDIHTLMYEIKLMIKQMSFFMEYFFQESRKGLV
mmetsp:Transcript_111358/g.325744  ORF Transcript_111358/g.325744 Transcript_111358/m.325744 type:complete len:738 (+) Transcript_111358:105-2318(+)